MRLPRRRTDAVLALLMGVALSAQSADTPDAHVGAAKALAANDPTALINLCNPPQARGTAPARTGQPPATTQPQGPPDRSTWTREPTKVFDKKMAALAKRAAGAPHPYVIGAKSLQNYLTIAEHCARAGRARLTQ